MKIHPLAEMFPPLSKEEFDDLCIDIRTYGLRDAISVYQEQILDGRHRYQACVLEGIEPRYDYLPDDTNPMSYVISTNLLRRHLTDSQRHAVAVDMSMWSAPGGDRKSENHSSNSMNDFPTQIEAAKILSVGLEGIYKAKQVKQKSAKLFDAVKSGIISTHDAYKAKNYDSDVVKQAVESIKSGDSDTIAKYVAKLKQANVIEQLSAQNTQLQGDKIYPVLLADPPWKYDFSTTLNRAIENQYPTMTVDELKQLPVGDIAHDMAVLYLWATAPKLREALEVMQAWGFEYKSQMVWVKPSIGMGYWARGMHELVLIGTKGGFPPPQPSVRPASVFEAPKGEHSVKPEYMHILLEELFPDMAKVELFARDIREGWESWGNEV